MHEQVHLGKVAGVKIGFHWSLLAIFGLIVFGLAAGQLPGDSPGRSAVAYLVTALAVAVVFFVSLVAHELAHAVVARRRHVEVNGIVLWLLGGVAQLNGESPDPGTELRIAAAGPAVSLALAAVFFGLSRVAGLGAPDGLLADGLGWLGWMNAALALFNLLPAYPLDGGRVLRSILWRGNRDRLAATRLAAQVGRAIGVALIAVGAVGFVAGAGLSGLWLALIGWFVAGAARAELTATRLAGDLAGCTVAEAMTSPPFTVPAWITVDRLMDEGVSRQRLSSFPVTDLQARFVGLVTVSAIAQVPPERWAGTPARAVARPADACVTCRPGDDLRPVAQRLLASPDRRAVVLDEVGSVVGIVSPRDVQWTIARRRAGGRHPGPRARWDAGPGAGLDVDTR